jgi:hypothetical protein
MKLEALYGKLLESTARPNLNDGKSYIAFVVTMKPWRLFSIDTFLGFFVGLSTLALIYILLHVSAFVG